MKGGGEVLRGAAQPPLLAGEAALRVSGVSTTTKNYNAPTTGRHPNPS